jgi:hypothetical protein
MGTASIVRKLWLFTATFVPLVAVAAESSATQAAQAGYTRLYEPGIACRNVPNGGLGANWSSLGNWTGSTQTVWCPLSNFSGHVVDLHVDVTSGWATKYSCYVSFMLNFTSGYWYNGDSVDPHSGYDTVSFDISSDEETITQVGAVQCDVPNNQLVLDYNSEIQIAFDAASW